MSDQNYYNIENNGEYCGFIEANLFLYQYWWVAIIIQVLFPIVLLFFCACFCGKSSSFTSTMTFSAEISSWFWIIYLLFFCSCIDPGSPKGDPQKGLMITAAVLFCLNYLTNICILKCSSDDRAIRHKITQEEMIKYFEAAKAMAPRHRVAMKAYHYENRPTRNNPQNTERVNSYTGDEDYIYDKWIDRSEFPDIGANQNCPLLLVAFKFDCHPGDEFTTQDIETFKDNYKTYVDELDAHSGEFHESIQVLLGYEEQSFRTDFVEYKRKKDNEDKEKGLQEIDIDEIDKFHQVIAIKNRDQMPYYMDPCTILIFTLLAISSPLKFLTNRNSKIYSIHIKKDFYTDPRSPTKYYNFMHNPQIPYMGSGRGEMPLLASTTGTRDYTTPNVNVVQTTDITCKSDTDGAVVSYYDEIKNHPNVQNF